MPFKQHINHFYSGKIIRDYVNLYGNVEKGDAVTITYLIQRVVGGDGNRVGVHHQPFSQQCEQTVCVHDLHLPPAQQQKNILHII